MTAVRMSEWQRNVLRMFAHDRDHEFIAEAMRCDLADVAETITNLADDDPVKAAQLVAEYDRQASLVAAAKPAEKRAAAVLSAPRPALLPGAVIPAPAAAPPAPPPPSSGTDPAPPSAPSTRSLLDRAARSDRHRTRALGEKILSLLINLGGLLDDEDRVNREAAERVAAARAAQLRVEELEQQLAAARGDLKAVGGRVPSGTSRAGRTNQTPSDREYDPRVVRAWAAGKGVDCPRFGKVPAGVVEAWRADTKEDAP